jgi:5S rRNA maturation endonuclease (ribonuclease M5)
MGEALERVVAALINYGSSNQGNMWNCPGSSHSRGDERKSLSVTGDKQGAGLYCHMGCTADDIAETIGLSMADLFDEPLATREVAHYNYVNLDGEILFVKTRYEPKGFAVFHPNGSGLEKGLGGAKRVLYRLPEVKRAIALGETIFVCEGEKDCDRLAREGLTATTNFDGANKDGKPKWKPDYTEMLAGAKSVVIIADRDEAGYAHAKAIKESLTGHVGHVKVLQAAVDKPGADISDHFDNNYGIRDLVPLNGAGFKIVSLLKLVSTGVPKPVFLAEMLYAGGLHCIAGAPDCGKTTIALCWAVSVMKNGQYVAFLDEEGGSEIVAEKLIALGATTEDLDYLIYIPFPGKTWTDEDIADLLILVKETGPALVLWDSSAAFLARAGLDENSAAAVTNWWARVLTPIAREAGSAVLVIDHDTKASEQSRYARGSGAKLAGLDVQFKVEIVKPFTREQAGVLKFHVPKDRRGWLHREWLVNISTEGSLQLQFTRAEEEEAPIDGSPSRRKIYSILSDAPKSYHQINDEIHEKYEHRLTRQTVSTECTAMVREGLVDSIGQPGYETRWFRKMTPTLTRDDAPDGEVSGTVGVTVNNGYLPSSGASPW